MENSITLMECLEVNFIELIILQISSKIEFGFQKVIRLETELRIKEQKDFFLLNLKKDLN